MAPMGQTSLALGAAVAALAGLSSASLSFEHQRHTLNFGANLDSHKHYGSAHSPNSAASILAFAGATAARADGSDSAETTAEAISRNFVGHLHPKAEFKVQSQVYSPHNKVLSTHYVQQVYDPFTHASVDVVNGLINVNVDTTTGEIISYGDSAWRGRQVCSEALPGYQHPGQQHVLGASGQQKTCETVYTGKEAATSEFIPDPRLAMISFLRIGNPSLAELDQNTLDLLESIHIVPSETLAPTDAPAAADQVWGFLHNVPGAVEPVPAKLAYVQTEDDLELVWSLEYQSESNWYEAHMAAVITPESEEPAPLLVADWMKDSPASEHRQHKGEDKKEHVDVPLYRVFHWGLNDPTEGNRSNEIDPHDKVASPAGWHNIPAVEGYEKAPSWLSKDWTNQPGWSSQLSSGLGANMTDTRGNNVFAQDNPTGGNTFEQNFRPQAEHLNFTWMLGWDCHESTGDCKGKDIDPKSYLNVSITQLFYTINMFHDLTYRYGFDEAAGNFQQRNFGRGGLGNDAVIANAQDGSGMNNANFATPPDGRNGKMRMYSWNGALPFRDGDLEAGIVMHEYTHGVSTRLTGGPANSGCLGWGEAGGMGEGWGDVMATIVRMHKKKPKEWSMGEWASGHPNGIRKYKYSVNSTTNPFTYKDCDKMWEVHSLGAVWAEFLFEVIESLIGVHGFSHELFPPLPLHDNSTSSEIAAHKAFYTTSAASGKTYPVHGNTLAVQLILDGMKLQPCRPNFLDARDAILAADHALTGGENYCTILGAFTKRGAGLNAALRGGTPWGGGFREEDFKLPSKCKKHSDH